MKSQSTTESAPMMESDLPLQKLVSAPYPTRARERRLWIEAHRGPKNPLDPLIPYAFWVEEEFGPTGTLLPTTTLLLTNRECPYRCLMCDLWKNTLDTRVPLGAIPIQITHALRALPTLPANAPAQIKLYNAGSFFDPQAIPPEDDAEIARLVAPFQRVIVESHPALIGERCLRFRDLLADSTLEVAIGLETVHPQVLERLNKRFTVEDFRRAADFLARHGIALRVFLLLRPPFLTEAEGIEWAQRSLEVALESGASVCCLIPTRGGNGAMEALAASGDYAPPTLASLEAAQEYGLRLGRGRVLSDLWDRERFADCRCAPLRLARLAEMNRTQRIPPSVSCPACYPASLATA